MISREDVVDYFGSIMDSLAYDTEQWGDDNDLWAFIANACLDIGLEEYAERLKKAFDNQIIDKMYISKHYLEQISKDKPQYRSQHYKFITDICDEMSWWCAFHDDDEPTQSMFDNDKIDDMVFPAINPRRHVGRNDPCPCGSGKKYKKCCL